MRERLPLLMIALIDNKAGLAALTKGYGKDVNINNMLAVTWRLIAHFGWNIHFEWVRSELNLGDAVSRFEFAEAINLGAQRLNLHFDELFGILVQVSKDSAYAHGAALEGLVLAAHYHLFFLRYLFTALSGRWLQGQCGWRMPC
eukprot:Skav207294  [mRNA]  locus=scaffold1463:93859:94290:- [translate_table: standard]